MTSLRRIRRVSQVLAWMCWLPAVLMAGMISLFVAGVQPIEIVDEKTVEEISDVDGSRAV